MKIYYYDIRTTNSFNYVRFELYYHVNHDTTFDKQLKKTGLYLMCYHHEYDKFNNKEIKNMEQQQEKIIELKTELTSIIKELNKKTFKLNYHSNKKEIKLTICEYLIKLLKQITNDENKINGSVLTCSKLILKYTLIYFKYEDKDSLTNIFNNFVNSDIRKNINLEYIIEKELLNHLLNEETDILDKHAFLENILYILPIDEGFNKTLIDLENYYSSILSKIDMLKREEFPEYGC